MRRSCDNITSVVIAFDNFYRKLDQVRQQQLRPGQICTNNDHEVFEEIQYYPVSDSSNDPNVIYIENDDHLESITESQNNEALDEA